MAVQVVVPWLGRDPQPGVVAEWYHHDGESVHAGEPVYRLESDNIAVDVEAAGDGILRLRAAAGEAFAPGKIIAFILHPGEAEPGEAGMAEPGDEPGLRIVPVPEQPEPAPENVTFLHAAESEEPSAPKPLPFRRTLSQNSSAPRGSAWENVFGDNQDFGEEVWRPDTRREPDVEAREGIVWPHVAEDEAHHPLENEVVDELREAPDFEADDEEAAAQNIAADLAVDVATYEPAAVMMVEEAVQSQPLAPEPADWDAEAMPQVYYAPAPLTLRVTVRMAEARKMRDQLAREWRDQGIVPENEDIVLRAFARAAMENVRLCEAGDAAGLVILDPSGDRVVVLESAAHGSIRERVVGLQEARHREEQPPCAFTLTSFGPYGLDEGVPAILDGHAFALAMGAARPHFDGQDGVPTPYMTLTLAYLPDFLAMGEAAVLLARVKELLEGPYALLAD